MTIRNFLRIALIMLFMVFAVSMHSTAAVKNVPPADSTANAKMLGDIVNRVTEIQNMDKTNLSISEKKALTKELKEMKRKADSLDKRVYLSVGAIIIIVLLLILLLK